MGLFWCLITALLGERRGKRGRDLAQHPRHRALYLPGSPRGGGGRSLPPRPPPSSGALSQHSSVAVAEANTWGPDAAPQARPGQDVSKSVLCTRTWRGGERTRSRILTANPFYCREGRVICAVLSLYS